MTANQFLDYVRSIGAKGEYVKTFPSGLVVYRYVTPKETRSILGEQRMHVV